MRNCKYKPFYSGLDIKYNPKSGQIRWVSHFFLKNPFSDRLHICSLFLETEEVRQSVSKLSKEVCSLIRQKCCSLKYAQMCFVRTQ